MTPSPPKIILSVVGALLAAGAVWAAFPRQASLITFNADRMADTEAATWRDYYDSRYLTLFGRLYSIGRDEFGFSPLDSLRISFEAADAARRFQPTTSRNAAEAARPSLERYYGLLATAAPAKFNPAEAGGLELDWWQARRENVGPDTYGLTIARISNLLYGIDSPLLREADIGRARAMAYRDARDEQMTDHDWDEIAGMLRVSYRQLKAAIDGAPEEAKRSTQPALPEG